MAAHRFVIKLGPNLERSELRAAADLLSESYSRWQTNPKNTCPVQTDTSPVVYSRLMRRASHEVILYYDDDRLAGVFVHSLSPQYDQYPLRKLSYLGVSPTERGYGPLKEIFCRYAGFVVEQGEDVVIASDLDQTTLNSLLAEAGFREIIDRNETFFLLSQLLRRRLFAFQKVKNDFVIDQIITLDGKAVRRAKKLFRLQTTAFIASAATPQQIRFALERFLGPNLPLRYLDLVEKIYAPEVEILPERTRELSDGTLRTAYRYGGPYLALEQGYRIRKDQMIRDILTSRGESEAPVVYLGSNMGDAQAVATLFQESRARRLPVVVFDFGNELTAWAADTLWADPPETNPWFTIVSVRDFYQIPVILEKMGLDLEPALTI